MKKLIQAVQPSNPRPVRELFKTRGVDPKLSHPVTWEVICQKTVGGARLWAECTHPNRSARCFALHYNVALNGYMNGTDADALRDQYPDIYMEINNPQRIAELTKLLWAD